MMRFFQLLAERNAHEGFSSLELDPLFILVPLSTSKSKPKPQYRTRNVQIPFSVPFPNSVVTQPSEESIGILRRNSY
jgi:hypothetical protein